MEKVNPAPTAVSAPTRQMLPDPERLRRLGANDDVLKIYLDAVELYNEADSNVRELGAVVAHPRTGAPIENPYYKIRAAAARQIMDVEKALHARKPKRKVKL